jgi:hypothetical protein
VYGTAGRGGDSLKQGGAGGVVGIAGSGGKGGVITIEAKAKLIADGARVVDADAGNGGTQYGTGGDGGNASKAIPGNAGKGGVVEPSGAGGAAGKVTITAPSKSGLITQTAKAGNAGLPDRGHPGQDGQLV